MTSLPSSPLAPRRPTFAKRCGNQLPHEAHAHVWCWVKQVTEPVGWFPPGTYADLPEFGHEVTYWCRGTL